MWGHCVNNLFKNLLNDNSLIDGRFISTHRKIDVYQKLYRKFFKDSDTVILNIHSMKLHENNTFKDDFEEIALNY